MGRGGDSQSTQYGNFSGGAKNGVAGGQNLAGMFANFGAKTQNLGGGTLLNSQDFSTKDMFKFTNEQKAEQATDNRADNTAGAGGGFSASIDAAAQVGVGGGSEFGSLSKTSDNSGGDGLFAGGIGGLSSSATGGASGGAGLGSLPLIVGGVGAGAVLLWVLLSKKGK